MKRKELDELTEQLVRLETVEGNQKAFEEAFDLIERYLNDFKLERFEKGGKTSMLVNYQDKPEVLLHGHIDVVEADKSQFKPEKSNGRIYGRGAADMKAGVAALVKTMEDLSSDNVGLLITSDEELGGFKGTGYFVENFELPEFVISAEPCLERFPCIVTEQKGVLQLRLRAEGDEAHASTPQEGVNAAEKLIEKYQGLKAFFPEGEYTTTLNLSTVDAGSSTNKVPGTAEAEVDIRYTEEYTADEVIEDVESIQGLEYEVIARAPMMKTSPDNRYVNSLREAAKDYGEVCVSKENFASDARFFTDRGVPAVTIGPSGGNIHGENEYVETRSIFEFAEILKSFL
ncbi:MAG: M20 family metallopeptidase, partial [Candidatus Nanohaloarchaea archaeon]